MNFVTFQSMSKLRSSHWCGPIFGFGFSIILGCDGGSAVEDAHVASTGRAVATAASSIRDKHTVNLLAEPAPVGATRVFQIVEYYGNIEYPHDYYIAEEIVSQFDELRIPINIIACDTYIDGAGRPANSYIFVMVLDVRNEDLHWSKRFKFVELTADNLTGIIADRGNCSFNRPLNIAEQRIQGLARRVYPHLFSRFADFGDYQQYKYRYYAGTDNYLGLAGDDVYVHNGRDWNFLYVGKVKDFIPYIDGIPGSVTNASAGQ